MKMMMTIMMMDEVSHVEVWGGQKGMKKVENRNGAGVPLRQGDHLHHRQGDC